MFQAGRFIPMQYLNVYLTISFSVSCVRNAPLIYLSFVLFLFVVTNTSDGTLLVVDSGSIPCCLVFVFCADDVSLVTPVGTMFGKGNLVPSLSHRVARGY